MPYSPFIFLFFLSSKLIKEYRTKSSFLVYATVMHVRWSHHCKLLYVSFLSFFFFPVFCFIFDISSICLIVYFFSSPSNSSIFLFSLPVFVFFLKITSSGTYLRWDLIVPLLSVWEGDSSQCYLELSAERTASTPPRQQPISWPYPHYGFGYI